MPMVDAGKLDRKITFQTKGTSRDSELGTERAGDWIDHATVSAEVQDVLPSRAERLDETINITRRPVRIRMRYRRDITGDMRIRYGDRILQVVSGPAEMGRREGLELMAEEYSSAEEVA